jgi:hypothetical protein
MQLQNVVYHDIGMKDGFKEEHHYHLQLMKFDPENNDNNNL